MITFSAQDLSNYGAIQSSSTLTVMGKVFVRGQSFSLSAREEAVKMAEQSLQRGCPCLLVDSDTDTTLWIEMQSHTPVFQSQETPIPELDSNSLEPSTKLTYRGQPVPRAQKPKLLSRGLSNTTDVGPETPMLQQTTIMSYRGQTFKGSVAIPVSDSSNDLSDERSPHSSSPKRKIQYRGQWVDIP